ncbi:unnamed protein product [Rhizoctonia solani]|uniref:F-box domain-containing protein n=1 Tax=Rhizoctonia solani TaxID=456999 RepID=A0A8H2WJT2_9AGAM|nr:unnamed protein product [Rhizoctonia solani]
MTSVTKSLGNLIWPTPRDNSPHRPHNYIHPIMQRNPASYVESKTVLDWAAAGASLASAASQFFELSVKLGSQCTAVDRKLSDLVTLIDESLYLLQAILDNQLTGACLALSSARNRLAYSILHLPHEIISNIFSAFVYDPRDSLQPSVIKMDDRVELIYRHLHTLLGVCTAWRKIGLSCRALWSVIPFVDPFDGRQRILVTELSLQRAGIRGLHLAASLLGFPFPRLQILKGHMHRFSTINVWSNSDSYGINEILEMLLENGDSNVSKLSLRQGHPSDSVHEGESLSDRFDVRLSGLLKSLSVLRVDNLIFDWEKTAFSNHLVELWISNVVLHGPSEIHLLLKSLSSAPELCDLKLISVQGVLDDGAGPIDKISFPKLKSLHLESLPFNFLEMILHVIVPGSHHLTLNPCDEINYNYPPDNVIEVEVICQLLRGIKVHKLILSMEEEGFWGTARGLRKMLKSVPTLKSLALNFYDIDRDMMMALTPKTQSGRPTQYGNFPKLELLEIYCATFPMQLGDIKLGFKALLKLHNLQKMVLGGSLQGSDDQEGHLLDESYEFVTWLRSNISEFHLCLDPEYVPELLVLWELWDV